MQSRKLHQSLLFALASLALFGCERCQTTPAPQCNPTCDEGFVCDGERNRCVAVQLPRFEGRVSGRAARITLADRRPVVAVIHPEESLVLTGFVDEDPTSFKILSQNLRAGTRRLGLAAGGGKLAISWIDAQGFYQVASRDLAGEPVWTVAHARVALTGATEPTYQATDDFDMAIDAQGEISLLFRDRDTRALHRLANKDGEEAWTLSLVDDGSSAGVEECPDEVRQAHREGLGVEPDLLFEQDTLLVAYHDADCGDLRLARLGASGRWLISVLDRGEPDGEVASHITGRFPSLAIDSLGRPTLSYQDLSRGRLVYGVLDGENYTSEVVDPGLGIARTTQRPKKIVGAFSTLTYDLDGQPFITYFDAGEANIVRARARVGEDGTRTWLRDTLEEDGLVGFFATHAFSSSGGLTLVSERLEPLEEGMQSSLVIVTEGL